METAQDLFIIVLNAYTVFSCWPFYRIVSLCDSEPLHSLWTAIQNPVGMTKK